MNNNLYQNIIERFKDLNIDIDNIKNSLGDIGNIGDGNSSIEDIINGILDKIKDIEENP